MKRRTCTRPARGSRPVGVCSAEHALPGNRALIVALALLAGATIWAHWAVLAGLLSAWVNSDDFSAGQLVPLVAAFLVWRDRRALRECALAPCWWAGLPLLALSLATQLYGLLYETKPSIGQYAFVLVTVSLVLLVAGGQVLRRLAWVLLLLCLMIPLPGMVYDSISGPLQRMATTGAVFLLEVFRVSVSQQGNVIALRGSASLEVAEACSGLRMLMAFIIVAAFIAYMVKRPRWQKGVLFLSSLPVAVICNVVRIFVTAVLVLHVGEDLAQKFFHDFAGFIMMPIAVMLLFGEIWVMDKIVVSESEASSPRSGRAGPQVIVSRRVRGKSMRPPAQEPKTVPRCPVVGNHTRKKSRRSISPCSGADKQVVADQVVMDRAGAAGRKMKPTGDFDGNSP